MSPCRYFGSFTYSHTIVGDSVSVAEVTTEEERNNIGNGALFAVVKVQGKQYRVMEGDVIMTDKIEKAEIGDSMQLSEVLFAGGEDMTIVGAPTVDNIKVDSVVEEQTKTEKIHVFKKKRRKGFQKRQGHRSEVTVLRITGVKKAKD